MQTPPTQPVTDSPWFWLYLFASIALIGLFVIQPKFQQRQAAIERKGQSRKIASSNDTQSSNATIGRADGRESLQTVSLLPIILILSVAVGVGWVVFFVRRRALHQATVDESGQS